MSTMPLQGGYFLFDGALLHGTPEQAWLQEQADAIWLYDDLGEEAALVGPALLPVTHAAGAVAKVLVDGGDARLFGVSRLISDQPVHRLREHLCQLRYLHAGETQRYYFRYADSRAFAAVWSALTPPQQAVVLGPVAWWGYTDRDGRLVSLRSPHASAQASSLPLTLQPTQWHHVLETGRIGELFDETAALAPCTARDHSSSQRLVWTRQTYQWLRQLGIADVALLREANAAIWRTEGAILGDTIFRSALLEAKQNGKLANVRRLAELGKPKEH